MYGGSEVLSLYEGFFAGGARILHSDVVASLHSRGRQVHTVLSINRVMLRESLRQRMEDDRCYRQLRSAGVRVASLGRVLTGGSAPRGFTASEIDEAAGLADRADVLLSLKEQPLRLVNDPGFPDRPVIVCLHRSDPEHAGQALSELRTAIDARKVATVICCAESTRAAYRAAGVPDGLLNVVPNGVDLRRFRPVRLAGHRAWLRRSLGVAADATVVTFAARYDRMKNVPLFLAAAHAFLAAEPAGHVLACGAGMHEANAELAREIGALFGADGPLRDRLHLLGLRSEMQRVYAASDVVALTSSFGEAAPLCLIEGMMCGAVPVATDVGDCTAIVAGHGLVVPADPAAIALAWQEAATRRDEFAPALLRARSRFSHRRMINAYAQHIERTRDAPRTGSPRRGPAVPAYG